MKRRFNSSLIRLALLLALSFAPDVLQGCETSNMLPKRSVKRGPRLAAKIASIPTWFQPADSCHVAGPIFFVGTRGLGVWLIETQDGDILLNTGWRGSAVQIEQSIRQLGRSKPTNIKYLIACHAHVDHVGGHAGIEESTDAEVCMMQQDACLLESGGKTDFSRFMRFLARYEPVKVDHILGDRDLISLGGVTVMALHTPGHSRGSTTFVLNFTENGQVYTVVFPDGTGINPGYRLVRRPSYPGIAEDFERTFDKLRDLKPDIWLTHHLESCDFHCKRARAKEKGIDAWVDPEGYRNFLDREFAVYQDRLKAERKFTGATRRRGGKQAGQAQSS